MKIIAINKLETCFNGDFVYKYTFDKPWTREAVQTLEVLGQLKVYDSFPKPMFQLSCGSCIVKGVQGTDECRITYTVGVVENEKEAFEENLTKTICLL